MHDHTCLTMFQLHVVEELFELFGIEVVFDDHQPKTVETAMAISCHALTCDASPRAFQLHVWLQGHEILMLVDFGSSTSFVDAQLAKKLSGVTPLACVGRVKVAGGGELHYFAIIPHSTWSSQGHEFTTKMKILPLGTYNAILGMDWLEKHSSMTVDWKGKHIAMSSAQGVVHLHSHPSSMEYVVINSLQLQSTCRQGTVSHMVRLYQVTVETDQPAIPEPIEKVVSQFEEIFGEPVGLPPCHACDHIIPLIHGAQPVNIRPYHHKPEHKTKIEQQVDELLRLGIIRHSTSLFSSPIILVRKKDGMWRLCVDYLHLNAMTSIAKYPVPIIEELFNELLGVVWFSKLDLWAGYHQIRIIKGDEYKTTFQTHSGHFEYTVMSLGLAGGPATFNGAMK